MSTEGVPDRPNAAMLEPAERRAPFDSGARSLNQPPSPMAGQKVEQMLDVRIPHVHAPHGDVGGWRGFATHVAVVAVGLLLAFGLEQGAEYVHHEFQRATLEAQMRGTFESNLSRAENDLKLLDGFAAYLLELRDAVNSRIAGDSGQAPDASDARNVTYIPPTDLGTYEASKINGSVSLLGLNRVLLYDRIEFQHNLMLRSFQFFFDTLSEVRAFTLRFGGTDVRGKLAQPNLSQLSAAQLLEYRTLLAKLLQYNRQYANQLETSAKYYRLMLNGVDDVNVLLDRNNRPEANQ